jgi:hypothetical protein
MLGEWAKDQGDYELVRLTLASCYRSLDNICKKYGPIRPEICGKIVVVVVLGLTYLYEVHRIIHRGKYRTGLG